MKNPYLEPAYKKHRLHIIKLRNWTCENELCPNIGRYMPVTLHHVSYEHGLFAPPSDCMVLCRECHALFEMNKAIGRKQWAKAKRCRQEVQQLKMQPQLYLTFEAA